MPKRHDVAVAWAGHLHCRALASKGFIDFKEPVKFKEGSRESVIFTQKWMEIVQMRAKQTARLLPYGVK